MTGYVSEQEHDLSLQKTYYVGSQCIGTQCTAAAVVATLVEFPNTYLSQWDTVVQSNGIKLLFSRGSMLHTKRKTLYIFSVINKSTYVDGSGIPSQPAPLLG